MLTTKFLAFLLALFLFLLVIELVRREKLTFKYAVGWLTACLIAIIAVVFDQALYTISSWCGFELTSNFIFFGILSVSVFLGLVMTIFLCQQDNRNRVMAQKIALLELEIHKLQGKSPKPSKESHGNG
mgnify:CR=1 FL=1